MPEFTNEIVELDELNRKVDANRKKRHAIRKRTFLRVLIAQLACLLDVLLCNVLRLSGILDPLLSGIVTYAATLVSFFLCGWYYGYDRKTSV